MDEELVMNLPGGIKIVTRRAGGNDGAGGAGSGAGQGERGDGGGRRRGRRRGRGARVVASGAANSVQAGRVVKTCFYCGQPGHKERHCRAKAADSAARKAATAAKVARVAVDHAAQEVARAEVARAEAFTKQPSLKKGEFAAELKTESA